MDLLIIEELAKKLQQELPGKEAHYRMAHAVRRNEITVPDHAMKAGVLALFYPKNEQLHIVLIERVSFDRRDRHSGQMSFPGGRFETEDGDLSITALRETEEEIGIKRSEVQLLGGLTELYIPVSNFLVHPFVGYLPYTPSFVPDAREVHAVVETPFNRFFEASAIQKKDMHLSESLRLRDVPFYDIAGKVVWGATAMMLSELVELTKKPL